MPRSSNDSFAGRPEFSYWLIRSFITVAVSLLVIACAYGVEASTEAVETEISSCEPLIKHPPTAPRGPANQNESRVALMEAAH